MKKLLIICGVMLVLLAAALPVRAQEFAKQHELRLSAGFAPITLHIGNFDVLERGNSSFESNYMQYKGPTYTTGTSWALSYGFRFTKWFDLSLSAIYFGQYADIRSNVDDSFIKHDRNHIVTLLPAARFTWLNRKLVRLYSSVAFGITFDTGIYDSYSNHRRWEGLYPAFQLVPVGIAVGRQLFGFAEIGVGTQGLAVVGIGYRFNSGKGGEK